MNEITSLIQTFHLLKHPFYQKWMAGELTQENLQNYTLQYYPHVKAFPRFVSAIHSHCEDLHSRKILLENLLDEEGYPNALPHPQLWKDFGQGLGLEDSDFEQKPIGPKAQEMVECFDRLTKKSYASGLGALYAYESQIPEIAAAKIQGLKERYQIEDPATLAFFTVHETADKYHSESCAKLIESLSEQEKAEACASTREACLSLWDFLTEVNV
ncbi:MAG TPA: CADD family putative folate metabolism protein [Pseudobdellovibrionaceae bacterium]|jgi:pyrroloquinoline-quinone synthase